MIRYLAAVAALFLCGAFVVVATSGAAAWYVGSVPFGTLVGCGLAVFLGVWMLPAVCAGYGRAMRDGNGGDGV